MAESKGRLDEQVQRAVGWFASLGRFESYLGLAREDRPLLPPAALRESLVNAVVHRDYAITGVPRYCSKFFAQYVDVTSPGGLPNHMSVESVRAGGHPRSRKRVDGQFYACDGPHGATGQGLACDAQGNARVQRHRTRDYGGRRQQICSSEVPSLSPNPPKGCSHAGQTRDVGQGRETVEGLIPIDLAVGRVR